MAPLPLRTRNCIRARSMSLVLQLRRLRNSQPASIDRHQEHAVARLPGRSQDSFHLAARVDFRAPGGALHVRDRCHEVDRLAPNCHAVEKAHGADGDVDAGG